VDRGNSSAYPSGCVCVSCVRVTTEDGYVALDGVLGTYTEREISPRGGLLDLENLWNVYIQVLNMWTVIDMISVCLCLCHGRSSC